MNAITLEQLYNSYGTIYHSFLAANAAYVRVHSKLHALAESRAGNQIYS